MATESTTDTLDTKQLLNVLIAFRKGDFSVRMPVEHTGLAGKVADTLNEIVDLQQRMVVLARLEGRHKFLLEGHGNLSSWSPSSSR